MRPLFKRNALDAPVCNVANWEPLLANSVKRRDEPHVWERCPDLSREGVVTGNFFHSAHLSVDRPMQSRSMALAANIARVHSGRGARRLQHSAASSLCLKSVYQNHLKPVHVEAVDLIAKRGTDVMVHAKSGHAELALTYMLPFIQRLHDSPPPEKNDMKYLASPVALVLVATPGLASLVASVGQRLDSSMPTPIGVSAFEGTSSKCREARIVVASPKCLSKALDAAQVDVNQLRMAAIHDADVLMTSTKDETVSAKDSKAILDAFVRHADMQTVMTMTAEMDEHEFAVEMDPVHHARAEAAREEQAAAGCCGGGGCSEPDQMSATA